MATGAPNSTLSTLNPPPGYTNTVMVTNASTLLAFVVVTSNSSWSVTSKDTPVLANSRMILAAPEGPATLYVGALQSGTLSSAASVYFSPGSGGAAQS
jgi:hypothetical protein